MQTPDTPTYAEKMRPETERRLTLLLYHPRHSSDPDAALRFARETLGMPTLAHATILAIGEADAVRLADALERRYPDRTARTIARTKAHFEDRP